MVPSLPFTHAAVTQVLCAEVRFNCKMHSCVSGEMEPNIRLEIVKIDFNSKTYSFLMQKFFFFFRREVKAWLGKIPSFFG